MPVATGASAVCLVVVGITLGVAHPPADEAAAGSATQAQTATQPADPGVTGPTTFSPLDPRVMLSSTTIASASSVTVTVPSVPSGTRAALLNVTATRATEPTRISACAGVDVTAACTTATGLAAYPGSEGSSLVIAPLGGTNGDQVTLANAVGDVTLAADLQGFFVDSGQSTTGVDSLLAPVAQATTPLAVDVSPGAGTTVPLTGVPAGATAAVIDVGAAVDSGAGSTLSVCPSAPADGQCDGTTALSADVGALHRNLVVVALGESGPSSVVLRSAGALVHASIAVQGYFAPAATDVASGRLYPVDGADLFSWQGIRPAEDVSLALPDVPAGAVAVSLRVTGAPADGATTLAVCADAGTSPGCAQNGVVSVGPDDAVASNNTLVRLDPRDPTHVTLRATGGTATARVELRGYVVPDDGQAAAPSPDPVATADAAATAEPSAAATATTSPGAAATATHAPGSSSAPPASAPVVSTATSPHVTPGGRPGAGNTGVPAGTNLTVHQGDLVISTPGAVVDSVEVHGFVRVEAPNVTIRNSRIVGGTATSSTALVTSSVPGASVVIEDSELFAAKPSPYINGVMGGSFTLKRVNVHDVIDQAHIYGNNVLIESSWFHNNLHYANDPTHAGGPSHDDNIQVQVGANIRVIGNTLQGSHNASLMVTQDMGKVADLQFLSNWADGGACTVNVTEKGNGPIRGLVINDNRFGTHSSVSNCAVLTPPTTPVVADGNVWDATGLAVWIRRNGS